MSSAISAAAAAAAAAAAGSVYLSFLERELVPNLLIMCSKSVKSVSEQQGQQNSGSGICSSEEPNQVTVVISSPCLFYGKLSGNLCTILELSSFSLSHPKIFLMFILDLSE